MSYSLNEIEALSKRAARGAGLSWGMSEEAAKATRWLASHDLGGVALLAEMLAQNDKMPHVDNAPTSLDGVWQAPRGALSPLTSGAALNDCAARLDADQAIEMAHVSHPLLIVPFAAWAAIHINAPVAVSWLDIHVETDGFGIWVNDPQNQIQATLPAFVTCTRARHREDPVSTPAQRGTAQPSSWAMLNTFAQRTYAPATEESRILGAGAGTSDND